MNKKNFVNYLAFEGSKGTHCFQKHREFLSQLKRYTDEYSQFDSQQITNSFLNKYQNDTSNLKQVSEVFLQYDKSKSEDVVYRLIFLRFRNKIHKKMQGNSEFFQGFFQSIQKLLQFQIKTIIQNRYTIEQIKKNLQYSYKDIYQNLQTTLDSNLIPYDHLMFNCKTLTKTEKLYIDQVQLQKRKKTLETIRVRKISNESLQLPSSQTRHESQCQICTGIEEQDFNQIVYCSKCSISAHQNCLGLIKVSKFQYICQGCKFFGPYNKYTKCLFCPCRGGALAQTDLHINLPWLLENFPEYVQELSSCQVQQIPYMKTPQFLAKNQRNLFYNYFDQTFQYDYDEIQQNQRTNQIAWIHYICGRWNKLVFQNGKFINVENTSKYIFFNQICYICELQQGVCIRCDHFKCQTFFHAECGRRANLHFQQYKYSPFYKAFCSQHLPLKISQALKQLENKKCKQIQKYHYLLKKLIRSYKDDFKEDFKNSLPTKFHKREKNRRKNSISQSRKNKKIIDDVKDVVKSMQYNIVIDLVKRQNNYYVQNIQKNEVLKRVDLEKDSKLWKILAKKKHQNPNYLYTTYVSAIKHQKYQAKSKKSIKTSPAKKYSPYNINLCDYCQSKNHQKPLWRCDFCNKVLHLKCLKYDFSELKNLPNYLFYCRKCKKRYRDRRERKKKGMELQTLEQGIRQKSDYQVQLESVYSLGQSRINTVQNDQFREESYINIPNQIEEGSGQQHRDLEEHQIVLDQKLFGRYQLKNNLNFVNYNFILYFYTKIVIKKQSINQKQLNVIYNLILQNEFDFLQQRMIFLFSLIYQTFFIIFKKLKNIFLFFFFTQSFIIHRFIKHHITFSCTF